MKREQKSRRDAALFILIINDWKRKNIGPSIDENFLSLYISSFEVSFDKILFLLSSALCGSTRRQRTIGKHNSFHLIKDESIP
jgi:hypothetical protein